MGLVMINKTLKNVQVVESLTSEVLTNWLVKLDNVILMGSILDSNEILGLELLSRSKCQINQIQVFYRNETLKSFFESLAIKVPRVGTRKLSTNKTAVLRFKSSSAGRTYQN